jgi:hypothetical protein
MRWRAKLRKRKQFFINYKDSRSVAMYQDSTSRFVYAGLKDNDVRFEYLNKAYDSRHPGLVLIRIEPMFDGLRSMNASNNS